MKKIFSFLIYFICFAVLTKAQSISVNTDGSAADNSSILDVKSTTKGMLVPRMTTAQRTAIAAPATGLLVFDTDTKTFWFYSGLLWTNISTASGGSFTLPFNGSVNNSTSAFNVLNTGNGAAIEGSGSAGAGVYGNSFNGAGVNALSTNGFGIIANSTNSSAVYGFGSNGFPSIKSVNNGTGAAIEGQSKSGSAVYGNSVDGAGVNALSTNGFGIIANSTNGSAIYGFNANSNSAIKGVNTIGDGVRGQSSGNGVAGVSGVSTSNSGYGVWGSSNTGTGILAQSSSGTALEVNGNLKIAGGNTNPQNGAVLTSDANGNAVWKKTRVAFGVQDGHTDMGYIPNDTWRKIQFSPTNFYDYGNNFDLLIGTNVTPTSSSFLAPVTGIYHFDAAITISKLGSKFLESRLRMILTRGGQTSICGRAYGNPFDDIRAAGDTEFTPHWAFNSFGRDIYLQAGDRIHIEAYQVNEGGYDAYISGSFNGHLVFAQ